MRLSQNAKFFFTRTEYNSLNHRLLSKKDYKDFIKDVHSKFVDELIKKGEFMLPSNLGNLTITKRLHLEPIDLYYKEDPVYNFQTGGYLLRMNCFMPRFVTTYTSKYSKHKRPVRKLKQKLFNFKFHRMNIKRRVSKLFRENKVNYDINSTYLK